MGRGGSLPFEKARVKQQGIRSKFEEGKVFLPLRSVTTTLQRFYRLSEAAIPEALDLISFTVLFFMGDFSEGTFRSCPRWDDIIPQLSRSN